MFSFFSDKCLRAKEKKINKLDIIPTKKLLLCTLPCEEDEMTSYRLEENTCNHTPDERLIYKMQEGLSNVNIKNQTIQLGHGQKT